MQFLRAAAVIGIVLLAATFRSLSVKNGGRDSRKMRRIQAIKQDILLRLGFDEEPKNPSYVTGIPVEFLNEYEAVQIAQVLNHEHKPCASLDFNVEEEKAIYPQEVKKFRPNLRAAVGIRNNLSEFCSTYRIKFQVDLSDDEFITSAHLCLRKFLLQLMDNLHETFRRAPKEMVDVRLVTRPANLYVADRYVHIMMETLAHDDISGLAVFNVTKAVIFWLESSPSLSKMGQLELDIQHRMPQSLTHSSAFIPNLQFFENSNNDGLLVLTTYKRNSNENNRNKRENINNDFVFCKENPVECCLKRFKVNFERDLNWTWVLRPKEIAFNYCQGGCPIKGRLSNEHTQLLDLMRFRTQNNPTAAPEPCCVPNSFSDTSLFIIIKGIFSIQNLNNVVATSCSCR